MTFNSLGKMNFGYYQNITLKKEIWIMKKYSVISITSFFITAVIYFLLIGSFYSEAANDFVNRTDPINKEAEQRLQLAEISCNFVFRLYLMYFIKNNLLDTNILSI